MSIEKLCELFSSLLGVKVYAINFPDYTEGTFLKMEYTSSITESGGVQDFNVQVMAKSNTHPKEAESLILEVGSKLNRVTNRLFDDGTKQLILLRSLTPQPTYVGETVTGEYIFSTDFNLLTTDI